MGARGGMWSRVQSTESLWCGEGGEGVAEEGYVPQSAESAPWPSGRACGKGIANLQASWMWGWGWGWESVKGE